MQELEKDSSVKKRDMRKYSIAENIRFIKRNDKPLYECLIDIIKSSLPRYEVFKEEIDEKDEFFVMLNTLKRYVPDAIMRRSPSLALKISEDKNFGPVIDIFEHMFLSAIEKAEFDELDPEVQKLYLKAQKIIDKEQTDEQ